MQLKGNNYVLTEIYPRHHTATTQCSIINSLETYPCTETEARKIICRRRNVSTSLTAAPLPAAAADNDEASGERRLELLQQVSSLL